MAGARKFSGLSKFLGGASKIVLAGDEPREVSAEELTALTDEAFSEGEAAGREAGAAAKPDEAALAAAKTEGFKAASDRFATVMGSDAGKANPAAALNLLCDEDFASMSADKLIGKVALFGAPAPKGEGNGGKTAAELAIEAGTPKVDLKTGQGAGQAIAGGPDDKNGEEKTLLDGILANQNNRFAMGGHLPGALVGTVQPASKH